MATCYRHPNRETGVSCSNCGRPICPDCMTPTPVGMRCPECSKQTTKVRNVRAQYDAQPVVTIGLIAINVLIFFGMSTQSGVRQRGRPAVHRLRAVRPGRRRRRVLPAAHERLPALGLPAHRLQHVHPVVPGEPARAVARAVRFAAPVPRLAADRLVRGDAAAARRGDGRRVRRDLRADGRGVRDAARPRHRPDAVGHRADHPDQPRARVHHPERVRGRARRRADRRGARRAS